MRLRFLDILLPREIKFFTYLNAQADVLIEGALLFKEFVSKLDGLSDDEFRKRLATIKECEERGDDIEGNIITELHRTFITPLDREDIHSMTVNIDRSLDILNSISQKFEVYGIRKVPKNVINFADIILTLAEEARRLMGMLETKEDLLPIVRKMHELENRGDYLFHISMAELFSGGASPVDVIKFKEVYEHLENIVDSIDYLGKFARGIMVKNG
ncbi:MAG: hypothetical protein A2293_13735 [Elusimicrobia bacterium RIFOXYB2_FULL_49_7]|nr:MAG: hypothetical protein A2293_13735 [Elusimicrobia bacterium RIFOXYB2_FULL_49_7]